MLSSLATAAPESHQLGPYVVNFDMNTDLQYEVAELEPNVAESATTYVLQASADNTTWVSVIISEYNEPIDATLVPQKQISALTALLNLYNVTSVDDITIDGKEGFMVSAVPNSYNEMAPAGITRYEVVYWLDGEKCECGPVSVGKTSVSIRLHFPRGCDHEPGQQPAGGQGRGDSRERERTGSASGMSNTINQ